MRHVANVFKTKLGFASNQYINLQQDKVEKWETMNDHYWCTGLGVEWFFCGSIMAIDESGGSKRCSDWSIGPISHHLGSLLGAIELTVLYAKCDILMSNLGRLYGTSLTYLPIWENVTIYLQGIKLWHNLHSSSFLYSISEKYYTNFKPRFLTKWAYFHRFRISTLCGSHVVTLFNWTPMFDGKTCS